MTLPDLAALVRWTSVEELPEVIGQLEAAKAAAWARLTAPASNGSGNGHSAEPAPERFLTPDEALGIIGGDLSRKWLLRHTKGRSFRRDHGRKVVRFEESGLRRWWSARRA